MNDYKIEEVERLLGEALDGFQKAWDLGGPWSDHLICAEENIKKVLKIVTEDYRGPEEY
jgi:hypothetical protein